MLFCCVVQHMIDALVSYISSSKHSVVNPVNFLFILCINIVYLFAFCCLDFLLILKPSLSNKQDHF